MIESLTIKNVALIEDISVRFHSGFNILTGETGAGKSILVGALGLLLGNKADTDFIRTGKEEAYVSGLFSVAHHHEALMWLESHGIAPEEGAVLLRRTLRRQGRGVIYIQDVLVSLQELSDFTDLIVDMHSQHAHQSLLRSDNHRKLLDYFAGLDKEVSELSLKFHQLSQLKKEEEELLKSESQRERELDYLEFAVKEIEEAQLKAGEDEKIESELNLLNQSEKLFSKLEHFTTLVRGGGALTNLQEASSALQAIVKIDENQAALFDRYQSAYYEIEDISEALSEWKNQIDFSPQTIDRLNSRQQHIKRLCKKYGGSIEAVLAYYNESVTRIDILKNSTLSMEKLTKKMDLLEEELRVQAVKISNERKKMAEILEKKITDNLIALGMSNARFAIQLEMRLMEEGKPACGQYGIDLIHFLFSANPGEPLKELRMIASGGELSRVMLSIKSVFADKDPISTLIFDEIDTGIGGAVARSIADFIEKLGECKQILCITHLASIAAKASTHFQIVKESLNGTTQTHLIPLDKEARVKEIARMLSGDANNELTLQHARQLLGSGY